MPQKNNEGGKGEIGTLSAAELGLQVVFGVIAIGLGLLSLVACVGLLTASFVTDISPSYWIACFLSCLISLAASMGSYLVAQSKANHTASGLLVFSRFVVLFWLVYVTILICTLFAFDNPMDKVIIALFLVVAWLVRQYAPIFWLGLWTLNKTTRRRKDFSA